MGDRSAIGGRDAGRDRPRAMRRPVPDDRQCCALTNSPRAASSVVLTSFSLDPGSMLKFAVCRYTLFWSAFSTITVVTERRY